MSESENLIQTVISTLNRLSGILHEPPESVDQPTSGDSVGRKHGDGLDDTKILGNDVFNLVRQHSGRLKRKKTSNILDALHERNLGATIRNLDEKAVSGTYEKDGDIFVCATRFGGVRIYDTRTDQTIPSMWFKRANPEESITECTVSPDARYLAYSMTMGGMVLQPMEREDAPASCFQLEGRLAARSFAACLKFAPSRDEIIAGTTDSSILFFDLKSLKQTQQITTQAGRIRGLALADPYSQIFYTGGDDGLIKVWDRRTVQGSDSQPVGYLAGHRNAVLFIDSKNDGRYLISCSHDQSIKLWDIRSMTDKKAIQERRPLQGSIEWELRLVRPNRTDSWASPASGDASVLTFRTILVDETEIHCRFSPMATTGQRFVYAGCRSGRVKIFDILSGKLAMSNGEFGPYACLRDVSWHPYLPIIKATRLCGFVDEYRYSAAPQKVVPHEYDEIYRESPNPLLGLYRDIVPGRRVGQRLRF
ncbi:DDB1- and CUL4-associated factor 11 [Galendromus occidentalis]|uniref:DDB1- and CUL4-associated factor 11 n=1 Tax=Galendromus occidentalis TaxID=34638 RepID=A0AAJ6QN09_9ACAR|nr:DDB1- and CUL4-associated factor 11 [Galendromus occidentalis]